MDNINTHSNKMSWRQYVRYDVKHTSLRKNSSWRQSYIMTKLRHEVKKIVMRTKIRQDVNKYIMMSKMSAWHQNVRNDFKNMTWRQRVCDDVEKFYMTAKSVPWHQNFVMKSNICHDIKKFVLTSTIVMTWTFLSWRKRYVITSKISSWRQIVCHGVNKIQQFCNRFTGQPTCMYIS